MPIKSIDSSKPILGYTLKHKLGAGGYGEVWAAEAPGGLPKAVKFIYGYHEEKRAQSELKALNRIRTVRHPFLLSLERIDVVDGQMIVITELADMCLKTRYDECVETGLKGIPRSELMAYMHEAAGALDFISDEFKLQHLDVKPENLLLVSGHIKVADFGLVKDIHDGTQSLMSGLTPAYAPPELFDGRPSRASDQYSLAILFQEMLTGVRPFDGATAAQLARQHINERPNLRPLPREDQATIAKALSKNPESRYANCTAMVDALSAERAPTKGPRPRQRTKLREGKRRRSKRSSRTESTFTLTSGTRQFSISPTATVDLPKIEYNTRDARCRPTLFLGIGNTGTRILQQIRQRLWERHGEPESLPAVRLLAVDTDSSELADACGSSANSLTNSEVCAIPLRSPKHYREDASMHLHWLSRRWIYNVPKSLRTEGIRPLGRLALATHIDELTFRLRQIMSELVQPEHLAVTAETLELDPDSHPRIVIVGAVSGGTCSGTAIDFAYIIRGILSELGIDGEDVLGVFTHSSTSLRTGRELSIANTLAFLNELYHFSCVEEYPGDESCDIPPSTDRTTTFASTYLVHLGDDLADGGLEAEVDAIAEYLYLASVSTCATYFDNCRRQEAESSGLPLRTLGICQTGRSDLVIDAAKLLGDQIVQNWTKECPRDGFDTETIALEILEKNEATLEGIVAVVHQTLDQVLGNSLANVTRELVKRFNILNRGQSKNSIRQYIASTFGFDLPEGTAGTKLTNVLDAICQEFVDEKVPKVLEAILAIVDEPGPRMAGAKQVAFALKQSLTNRRDQLESHVQTVIRDLEKRYRDMLSEEVVDRRNLDKFFRDWANALLQRFTLESTIKLTNAALQGMARVNESVHELSSHLSYITSQRNDQRQVSGVDEEVSSVATEFHRRLVESLRMQLPRLASRVEREFQTNLLNEHGGMRAVLQNESLRDQFQQQFIHATRISVVEHLRSISLNDICDEGLTLEQFSQWVASKSRPLLTKCGGSIRRMYAHPLRAELAPELVGSLQAKLGENSTGIPATVGELIACVEAERVPLENVAMHLLQHRPDSIEYASRLHTRTDIAWTHISSMR